MKKVEIQYLGKCNVLGRKKICDIVKIINAIPIYPN